MRCRVVELTDGKSIWTASEGQQPQSAVMDKAQQERIASAISEAKSCLLTEKGIDASSCTHFFRVCWTCPQIVLAVDGGGAPSCV